MQAELSWLLATALHGALVLGVGARILLREDGTADSRMAWLVVIVLLPYLGALLYLLMGEIRLGPQALGPYQRAGAVARQALPDDAVQVLGTPALVDQLIAPRWQGAFRYGESINGCAPRAGNAGELMADGDAARARMVADMDAAQQHISVLYYIWLDDGTGQEVAQALMRAARRGVTCRAMVDGLGSRALTHSALWRRMQEAGVHLAVALPISRPLKVLLTSRIDLRNHRKITLIDGRITYCGSQNCADAAFRVKARYAPWVDIMLRLQGPVVAQMQLLFASDWMQTTGQPLDLAALTAPALPQPGGFAALVVGEGPVERRRSTPQLVSLLLASARRRLTLSTPYFVPDATVLDALCAAAWRGVQVTLILPRRNDSWIVAAASRSNYLRLLQSGVAIHEFRPGLLHAKTLTLDDEVSFMGSTNLDLRSFDLNFENNVLLQDAGVTAAVAARQAAYLAESDAITLQQVRQWPRWRRMWHNALAMLSPLL